VTRKLAITPRAVEQVRRAAAASGADGLPLRVAAKREADGSVQLGIGFDTERARDDTIEMAGVTHADIDVAQFYDAFTIVPMLALEALGFCKPGESGAFVSGQRTAPGGDFPMNTNGGGLSYTHTGMYGIFTLIEAARQLRGECGARQVQDATVAICHGTGGVWSAAATMIAANAL